METIDLSGVQRRSLESGGKKLSPQRVGQGAALGGAREGGQQSAFGRKMRYWISLLGRGWGSNCNGL